LNQCSLRRRLNVDTGSVYAFAYLRRSPIDRGLPAPALLAHITTSKFAYHIPLYRQSVMYARDGVEIEPRAPWATGWAG
jgi:transposase